ncbi:nucleoside transporter C-terminal domain-containing protein [Novosphingobium sp.]|uniref:NupC/NupG family nucleoside CNT transporter n=1 Tax=Novosphingobium sp. TaxID=1874826 RepID=UPI0022C599F1|nr:nucleoside transporter C-terminal domain-containing protein [Novosphingobium sp.]MCZ8018155.1 nucleoside:proton symporter [Novosphingobium sp.]MCZ8033149.1 nucleoside:proton symporter [Novosphingobium sp.]MCZ8051604.1 nucleoside:proton symporter [Novosphingobium sp.]MCZ8060146.1 nucleoside:proton symporter [Novosphingobium sp.]MCZ8231788.1 nucleoside:proton symporter [Novosphingobium sp.]
MSLLANLQGLIGLALILLLAWGLSEDRAARPGWRWIGAALLAQLAIALVVTRVPFVWDLVGYANRAVAAVERATLVGSSYMFGYTGGAPIPFLLKPGEQPPVVIAFQILPLIIVFSALSALLWHWGVLRVLVRGLAWALRRTLGVRGEVGLAGGATVFLGVVETPLVLRAWLGRMNRTDLFTVMCMIMATISGAILVLYATTLSKTVPNAVGHMIVASLISLPAAVLIARLMVPGAPETAENSAPAEPGLKYEGSMDALVRGAMEGVTLVLAVIGIIITVFALVNLVDQALALLPLVEGTPLTLRRLFGWALAPLMWTVGVPWDQAGAAGALMGTKAVLNEYVAYLDLAALPAGTLDPRSLLIVTYALCGVANLASVGLIVSTMATLAPERRAEVAGLGMKSWIAGNFASLMTGAVIGLVTWR